MRHQSREFRVPIRRILVLFGGKGIGAAGYAAAGFVPVCVDLEPSPSNPYEVYRADALEVLQTLIGGGTFAGYKLSDFVAIHASPPCQKFSVMSKSWNGRSCDWPDLIGPVRALLKQTGLPYVIENVVGAPLENPVKLCGSMFDLPVERHRLFEASFPIPQPVCDHKRQARLWPEGFPALRSGRVTRARVVGVYGNGGGDAKDLKLWRWAMRVPWSASKHDLAEAVPPAYAEYVGRALMGFIETSSLLLSPRRGEESKKLARGRE